MQFPLPSPYYYSRHLPFRPPRRFELALASLPVASSEKVALLKVAAGLSDEELTWRMETAKPEANAYRIASAALEKAESTYERLLWRQVGANGHAMASCGRVRRRRLKL